MNDNDTDAPPATGVGHLPDSHGHAAYLLVECLLHELIARGTIDTADAIVIVDHAIETEIALADEHGVRPTPNAAGLLRSLSASLNADLTG